MEYVRPTLANLFALIASLPEDEAAAILNAPLSHYEFNESGRIVETAGIGVAILKDGSVVVDFDENQNTVWILNKSESWKIGTEGPTNPLVRWPGFLNAK